jgi:hypothetical protein
MNTKSMLLAGGLAGIVMGVLAAIPLIGILSSCCCLWAGLWGCGILAVWVYRLSNKTQPSLTVGQGVLLGLGAGLVGAVIVSIFGAISSVLFSGSSAAQYSQMIEQMESMGTEIPAEYAQIFEQYFSAAGNILVSTLCNFVIFPLFGMIGGLIGTALIWKNNPPSVQQPMVQ